MGGLLGNKLMPALNRKTLIDHRVIARHGLNRSRVFFAFVQVALELLRRAAGLVQVRYTRCKQKKQVSVTHIHSSSRGILS